MAEFPALPLWTDAYLGDTTHLTALEHGAYLMLLMTAWRTGDCALPDDDRLLARYARCEMRQWKKLRPILEPFFVVENSKWRQLRLQDEFQACLDRREKAAANGRASALKRKGRHSTKRKQRDSGATTERERSENLTITNTSSVDKSTAQSAPRDPIKDLFDLGVSILTEAGVDEARARSLVGKWRKDRSDGEVLTAFIECQRDAISEPVEWLTKRLQRAKYVSKGGYEYHGSDEDVYREATKRGDNDTAWSAHMAIERAKKTASG